jgi:hypothetical protein
MELSVSVAYRLSRRKHLKGDGMSRGSGRVEREIERAFAEKPDDIFMVEDLVRVVYPGLNRTEKKHRVAVIRAADQVARRCGWIAYKREAFGHELVYCNLMNVRSYTLGRMRASFLKNDRPLDELRHVVDGGTSPCQHRYRHDIENMKPGGAWWIHVEIHKAAHAGDASKAEEMQRELNAGINRKLAILGMGK